MAFFFLIIYIAIVLVRPQEWYEPLAGYQLVNVAAILTIFTTFVSQRRDGESLGNLLTRNVFARLMWVLFSFVILSHLTRFRFSGAVEAFTEFGKVCILFFLTMILCNRQYRLQRMLWVLVFCAMLMSVHAIMQVRTGYGLGNIPVFGSFEDGEFRVQGAGLFMDPNEFAAMFVWSIPFVIILLRLRTLFILKVLLICTLPGALFALYYTKSRGGLVGFCAMLVAYLWPTGKTKFLRFILLGIVLGTAVALGPERSRESYLEGSAEGRIIAWGYGNSMLKQNPLFGIGWKRFTDFSDGLAAHSSYVACYSEIGLIGYFCWFSIFWLVIRSLFQITKLDYPDSRTPKIMAEGLFAGMVGYQTSVLFVERAYTPVVFFLAGLGVGLIRYVQSQSETARSALTVTHHDLIQSGVFAALSIPVIWIVARLFWATGLG